jgi:hypothetical protein
MADLLLEPALPHLPRAWANGLVVAAGAVGLPVDQFCFVSALILAIPLGWAHRFVPGVALKHWTGMLIGVALLYFNVGPSSFNVFISSSIAYALILALMPSKAFLKDKTPEERMAARKVVGNTIFVFAMAYMCASHIYRLYVDYLGFSLDFTSAQMILTLKLVSFAWSRVDGENVTDGYALDTNADENEYRRVRAIPRTPSLLEYFAWVYYFPGVIAGPAFEYNDYIAHTTGDRYRAMGLPDGQPPFSWTAPLTKVLYMVAVYPGMHLAGMFPISGYVNTAKFALDYPAAWQRVLYVSLFNGLTRYKYYFAWYLAEAGTVASGLALSKWDPKTKTAEWNACTNCRALSCELAASTSELTSNWNIFTSEWLKHQVYLRVSTPAAVARYIAPRTFANLATKFTSAFWHGFYPGYYIFFFQVWFIQTFELKLRALLLPFFSTPNAERPARPHMIYPRAYLYRAFMNVFVMGSLAWLGSSFVLLEFTASINILLDSYMWYHVLGMLTLVFIPMLAKKIRGGGGKRRADKDKAVAAAKEGAAGSVTKGASIDVAATGAKAGIDVDCGLEGVAATGASSIVKRK